MEFDFIILILLIAGFGLLYDIWCKECPNISFGISKKLLLLLTAFILLIEGVLIYGSFIEPRLLTTKKYEIHSNKDYVNYSYKDVNIALVSDFHVGTFKKGGYVKKVANEILLQKPDLVIIAGDMITDRDKDGIFFKELEELASKIPTFAVWGNHDYHVGQFSDIVIDNTETTYKIFKEIGITVLKNESKRVVINNQPIWLIGTNSVIAKLNDLNKAIQDIPEEAMNSNEQKIVISHNPDILFDIKEQNIPIDLVLSGHTHGGQIRIPLFGAIPSLPIRLGQKYDKGLFEYKGFQLFITSGVGESGTRARLFNRPEVSLLKLLK